MFCIGEVAWHPVVGALVTRGASSGYGGTGELGQSYLYFVEPGLVSNEEAVMASPTQQNSRRQNARAAAVKAAAGALKSAVSKVEKQLDAPEKADIALARSKPSARAPRRMIPTPRSRVID